MSPRQQAVLFRFLEGLVLTEIPIVVIELTRPTFDWRITLAGLLGGLATALSKYYSPQLTTEGIQAIAPALPVPTEPHG